MKSRAAVLWQVGEEWTIEDIEIDDPGPGEVIVKTKVAGMCHSDEHMSSGALPMPHYPCIGGHEGAGEVIRVGEGVTSVAVGDHVAMSFIPSCGRCKWCVSGRQNLCDLGMHLMSPGMISDGRMAHHVGDQDLGRMCQLGTFAEHMLLSESAVVKVEPDIPWHAVALVSCGVATGWGSAVHRAQVTPGDEVAVIGSALVAHAAGEGHRPIAGRLGVPVATVPWPLTAKTRSMGTIGRSRSGRGGIAAASLLPKLSWATCSSSTLLPPASVYCSTIWIRVASSASR